MKKGVLCVLLIAVMLLTGLLAGCTSKAPEETSAPQPQETAQAEPTEEPEVKEDIVIGLIQDLSGPGSVFGNACLNGSELAITQINEAGGLDGHMIKLVPYDIKGSTEEAINAYKRLADVDKAVAVVGPPLSNVGLACIPVTNETGIPFVGAFGHPDCMVNEDGSVNPYMFLAQPSSSYAGKIVADYSINKLENTKFAVIARQDHSYLMTMFTAFVDYVESHGGEITSEQYCKESDKDYKVQINKMAASEPDMMVAFLTTQDLVILTQQMNQLGVNLPLTGSPDFSLPFTTLLSDPTIANDIYFPNNLDYEEEGIQDVRAAYVEAVGEEPSIKSYIGYDEILLIAEAIKQAGYKYDSESIRNALENDIKDLQVTQGMMSMDPSNHMPTGLSMVMYKIENGEYVLQERYQPED